MSRIYIFIFCCFCHFQLNAQSRGGVKISALIHGATVNAGTDTSLYISTSKQKYGLYPSACLGFVYQISLSKHLALEPQLLTALNGHRYIGKDARTQLKTKGSINQISIDIPLNLIVKLPFNNRSGNFQIGGGPFYSYNVYGLQKEKTEGLPYTKNKIAFNDNTGFKQDMYGLQGFIGIEDAERSCLRIGGSLTTSEMYKKNGATIKLFTGSISYISYF